MNVKPKKLWNMEKTICKVIWVDDEIEDICPEIGLGGLKRELRKYNIEVIGKAHSFIEFRELFGTCRDRVDAVITDANFNDKSRTSVNDEDFKGLIKIINVIDSCNEKKDIPFYLYSGKEEYFKFHNGELDYFDINGRRFRKGDFEKMFKKIREDVEHINSASFRIRKKYAKELEAAALIKGNEETVLQALLYEDSGDLENIKNYFNPLRQVIESILEKCKKQKIIPEIDGLNAISNFLGRNNHGIYTISEHQEIMPKPLARALWYFLDIVQDASHKKEDANLGVGKYVSETSNINLFRSVLNIAMDLCIWYAKCEEEACLPDFTPKWVEREYEYEGIVRKEKEKGKYYCGRYLLTIPKDGRFQEGDTIRVIESTENCQEHFLNDEGLEVDRFASMPIKK